MKAAIVSKTSSTQIRRILKKHKIKIVKKNPDLVITNGGDGIILYSERLYPGIPKIALKTSKICRNWDYTPKYLDILLSRTTRGKYKIKSMTKIQANFKNKK